MQSTLFTTLTATEEANLSGGKSWNYYKKAAPKKEDPKEEDPKKDPKALVKLNLNLNVVSIAQNNVSVGDVGKLTQSNVAVVTLQCQRKNKRKNSKDTINRVFTEIKVSYLKKLTCSNRVV